MSVTRSIGTTNNQNQFTAQRNHMKKLNLFYATLALAVGSLSPANASIIGSAHDFSTETSWNVTKDVCGPCHMAHGSDPANQLIPLWSHQTDLSSAWQPYVSPHNTTIGNPNGASLACLSCHDATLAYNQLKGATVGTPEKVQGDYVIGGGGDLRGDHPISFLYNDAVNNSPTNTLKLATTTLGSVPDNQLPVGNTLNGQTVSSAFLKKTGGVNGYVQCTSCHDVHRSVGDSGINSGSDTFLAPDHNHLLVVYNTSSRLGADGYGSSLCRSCHNK